MAVSGVRNSGSTYGAGSRQNTSAATDYSSAVQSFMSYMQETPEQRMEDAWLRQHGLTRQRLAAMSPQQREAVLRQMAQDIKRQLQQDADKKSKTAA